MAAPFTAAGQPKYGLRNDLDGLRSALPALVAPGQQVYSILHASHVCVEFAQKVCTTTTAFDGIIITSPAPTSISAEFSSAMKHLSFDVFINHHGGDVKHTLADSIYNSLHDNGLKVFLDKNELELGDYFPVALEEAMRNASIHIAIFSENYAHSPWCLAELAFMLKTGIRFIPIFYHVEPSSLRWAHEGKGSYAGAFYNHEIKRRYTSKRLESWKMALHKASLFTGETIINEGDEEKAVNRVLKESKEEVPSGVARCPMDLIEAKQDSHNIALKLFLGSSSDFAKKMGAKAEPFIVPPKVEKYVVMAEDKEIWRQAKCKSMLNRNHMQPL